MSRLKTCQSQSCSIVLATALTVRAHVDKNQFKKKKNYYCRPIFASWSASVAFIRSCLYEVDCVWTRQWMQIKATWNQSPVYLFSPCYLRRRGCSVNHFVGWWTSPIRRVGAYLSRAPEGVVRLQVPCRSLMYEMLHASLCESQLELSACISGRWP
jgi:hypothetical protein